MPPSSQLVHRGWKFEIRSTKFETNPKSKAPRAETLTPVAGPVLSFEFRTFVLVSNFEFRISNFAAVRLVSPGNS
jgi:hypothetical protein